MGSFKLSKSGLGVVLSRLSGFQRPKVRLEQYPTDAEIAADMLWNAYLLGDIKGKAIIDLGCGTGILGIGALILGAKGVSFIDIDEEALDMARNNLEKAKSETSIKGKYTFLREDVQLTQCKGDVVVQNPPFGVKVRHKDREFLEAAVRAAPIVHTLHKSESDSFIMAFCRDIGYKVTHQKKYIFPLKATMDFHRKKIERIDVKWYRLERNRLR